MKRNMLRLEHNNLRLQTIYAIMFYIMLAMPFDRYHALSILASIPTYAFLAIGALYMINKRAVVGFGNYQLTIHCLLLFIFFVSFLIVPQKIMPTASVYMYGFFTNAIICFFLINVIYSKKDINMILTAFVIGGLLLSITFYLTYRSHIWTLAQQGEAVKRLGRVLGNVNEVAQKSVFSVLASVYFVLFDKRKNQKRLCFLNLFLSVPVIFFTGSKRALIVMAIAVFVMFLMYARTKKLNQKLWVWLGGILALGILIYMFMNIPAFSAIRYRFEVFIQTLMGKTTQNSTSDLNRIRYIQEGLAFFKDNFIFGGGFCYSYYLFGTYTHNNYIEMLVNHGIVGFITYYSIHLVNLKNIIKFKNPKYLNIRILFLVFEIALLIVDIGVVTYYDRYICIIMAMISSFFTNEIYLRDENGVYLYDLDSEEERENVRKG